MTILHVEATAAGGLQITVDGQQCELAVVTPEGLLLLSGQPVADAVETAAVDAYKNLLRGRGHLRTVVTESQA